MYMILNTFPLLHCFFNSQWESTANQIRTCYSIEWATTSDHYFMFKQLNAICDIDHSLRHKHQHFMWVLQIIEQIINIMPQTMTIISFHLCSMKENLLLAFICFLKERTFSTRYFCNLLVLMLAQNGGGFEISHIMPHTRLSIFFLHLHAALYVLFFEHLSFESGAFYILLSTRRPSCLISHM